MAVHGGQQLIGGFTQDALDDLGSWLGDPTKQPISDLRMQALLGEILLEMRRMNMHLQAMTDERIHDIDLKRSEI